MAERTDPTKLVEEVGEVLKNANQKLIVFKNNIINKNVVAFFGNTRSGKSTLVNYTIGTTLVSFEERRPIFKIRKANEQSAGPVIGQGSQSCTTIPGIYPMDQLDTVVIDAPGFDDNRGESQDIINALYINQIKYAKTVKFVLVSDINELAMDNIKGFTDLIEKIHALFPNFENLKKSVSIVFTKDYRDYSRSDMASLLKTKIIDVDNFIINKQLLQYFVENDDLIGLFKMPAAAGVITNEIEVNIEGARATSCALSLNEECFKTALSSKSRLVLLEIYQNYLDSAYFEQELQRILTEFNDYFAIVDYVLASTKDELDRVKQALTRVLNLFRIEHAKRMSNMSDINNSLIKIFATNMSQQFVKTFTVLVMIDNNSLMEDAIKDKFITKYKRSLKDLQGKIEKLLPKIDQETADRRKSRQLFNAAAATTGVAGGATVLGEVLHTVLESSRIAPFGLLGIASGIITSVGAGVAATSYVVREQTVKKRIQARQSQGRRVFEGMFADD